MKKLILALTLLPSLAVAQSGTYPLNSVLVGKGPGVQGFGFLQSSSGSGQCLQNNSGGPLVWGPCGGASAGVSSIGGAFGIINLGSALMMNTNTLAVDTGSTGHKVPFLDGANIWSTTQNVGLGSGNVQININGGNSGVSDGASLHFQAAGLNTAIIGNRSSIFGGAFNSDLTFYSGSSTNNAMHFFTGGDDRFDLNSTGAKFLQPNQYLNFGGSISGAAGFGIRDNGGVMELKNSGGSWLVPLTIPGWTPNVPIGPPLTGGVISTQGIYNNSLTLAATATTYNGSGVLSAYVDFSGITDAPGCCFATNAVQFGSKSPAAPVNAFVHTLTTMIDDFSQSSALAIGLGVNSTAKSTAGGFGTTFGIGIQTFNETPSGNARSVVGMEIDLFGSGSHTSTGLTIFTLQNGSPHFTDRGMLITTDGVSSMGYGAQVTGNVRTAAFDTASAVITTGKAIRIGRGQSIELDPRSYIFFDNATSQLKVNIDGTNYVIKP